MSLVWALLITFAVSAVAAPASATLAGELICYARFVVNDEWDRMRDGTIGNSINNTKKIIRQERANVVLNTAMSLA